MSTRVACVRCDNGVTAPHDCTRHPLDASATRPQRQTWELLIAAERDVERLRHELLYTTSALRLRAVAIGAALGLALGRVHR